MSTMSQFLGGGVKSIQRGLVDIGFSATTTDVTISAVVLAKSLVNISIRGGNGAGSTFHTAQLTTPTNLQLVRTETGSNTSVSWEVVEFV